MSNKDEANGITRETLPQFLSIYMADNQIDIVDVAKAIGCTRHTIMRIIAGKTYATDEMLKQCSIMIALGFKKYKTLTDAEKETISDAMGAVGSGVLGFGSITAAISTLGIAGLSSAGITSGLAALGSIIGGGMVAGVSVAATIPIAAAAAGYGLIRGIKYVFSTYKISSVEIDEKWEIKKEDYNTSE